MGRGSAYPKVCTDHVLKYISLRNRTDSPSDCPLVTSPLLLPSSGIAHHRSASHLHSTSCGPGLPLPPPPLPAIHCLPTCSLCITGLPTMLSSESPHLSDCCCWQFCRNSLLQLHTHPFPPHSHHSLSHPSPSPSPSPPPPLHPFPLTLTFRPPPHPFLLTPCLPPHPCHHVNLTGLIPSTLALSLPTLILAPILTSGPHPQP